MIIGAVFLLLGAVWFYRSDVVALFEDAKYSFLAAVGSATGSATLTWNANSESDVASYKVYYGTSPRTGSDPKVCGTCGYTTSVNVGRVTSHTISNLTNGTTYYFSVTAVDTSNNESSFSAEATKTTAAANDTTAPTITAFTIPTTASSLTISVTSFTATDATGVVGYKLTESATPPSTGDTGWSSTYPASYTFSSAGSKTLYAWAKDVAGNVSASAVDSVTVTLPSTTSSSSNTTTSSVGGGGGGGSVGSNTATTVTTPSTQTTVTTPSTVTTTSVTTTTKPSGLSEVQIQSIISLLNSFSVGQDTINKVTLALRGSSGTSATASVSSSGSYSFASNLSLNQESPDVKVLQQFLNTHGFIVASSGLGSPNNESTFFGIKTYAALVKFQESVGLPATGWFGPMTREKMSTL